MKKWIIASLFIVLLMAVGITIFKYVYSKSQIELQKEMYVNIEKLHESNNNIVRNVYEMWVYSKSQRGMFSNTLYQELEREHNIPFEFVLTYYNLTDKYELEDTYGRINILDQIDSKLEDEVVFVVLKYYENEIMANNSFFEELKSNIKRIKKEELYETFVELYTSEIRLQEFLKKPSGTILGLEKLLQDINTKYDENIQRLKIEFED